MSTPPAVPTGFFLPPAAPLHDPGWGHPEHQGRLRAIASAVGARLPDLHERVRQIASEPATHEQLTRVHPMSYLERLEEAAREAKRTGRQVLAGPETPLSGASWEAIAESSGAAVQAVTHVVRGALRNAFVATRPPGHHASAAAAMGFCAVNHVAVAARHLQATGEAERVAIVDWDVHHGNGTQDLFYEDGGVFYASLHESPLFPGTGAASERGRGAGEGTTLNVPLRAGTSGPEYLLAFEDALARVEGDFRPDFVLVSAGYDALAADPLGGLDLEPNDFAEMTRLVTAWADRVCSGRVVAVLEGGYHPERTGAAAVATLLALCGAGEGGRGDPT